MKKIAIILPDKSKDYIANTVLEGFRTIEHTKEFEVRISPRFIPIANYSDWELDDEAFFRYARAADLIIYIHAKYTVFDLVNKIDRWDKTVVVDGHEVGKNYRYDREILKAIEEERYERSGGVEWGAFKKCRKYFRREKPYIKGIIPLPFGIENRFIKYKAGMKKDIDFTCIFGQEEFPPLRKEVRLVLEKFCSENGFTCMTKKTRTLFDWNFHGLNSQRKFHKQLARTKVGISVGGSGFDTLRFWEILANNCVMLTENIDIYEPGSSALRYKRVFEFKDLDEFKVRLEEMGKLIRSGAINQYLEQDEYERILKDHLCAARVRTIVDNSF